MITVTIGGVTIGLGLLGWELIRWWPGQKRFLKNWARELQALAPFLLAWCYGTLGVLTVQGVVAWAFDTALWASNWLGDAALWFGVGEDVGQGAQGFYVPLSTFGNCAVFLLTLVVIATIKFRACGGQVKRGVWCGLCLGTSSSVAGLAALPLAQGVNWLGELVYNGAGVVA